QGKDCEVADQRDRADQRDAGKREVIGIAEQPEPSPAGGGARALEVFVDRQGPERRKLLQGHKGRQQAARVHDECGERGGERYPGRGIEPARVTLLDQALGAHVQRPRPRASARTPARSRTAMTTRRTTEAGVWASRRAPSREPSITPRIAGTASTGSSAPRWT